METKKTDARFNENSKAVDYAKSVIGRVLLGGGRIAYNL